ncbi:PREDICTED: osteoclast-associated immunoglobulin-like receptor [Mandrillus leucophaeus]|uniref:osteoclast-associated immunoglobulin-like receptor n=1 Tax=Mandrillus leucophaeus TaxID=9568 RepID=UPI0005F49FDF|nr:PREDICTED: osteoclast-associated immunoglobulin-like receptor [Mandrillus leucophaeus]
MALVLILQLLTLWPLCHTDITPSVVIIVPPALYHKPWLGAQPATVVTPGVNVTLRCRAPQPAWRFGLFKLGEISPPLFRDVSSELAEFFLEEVTPAQGGSYHCCYRRPDWRPGVWSQPSDPLELLVTVQTPSPSSLRPGSPDPQLLLPQTRESRSPVPPPSDPGVQAPSPSFLDPEVETSIDSPSTLRLRSQVPKSTPGLETWSSGPRLWGPGADGPSLPAPPADSSSSDYTRGNLVRLGLAGLVLISLGALVTFDWRSQSRAPAGVRP